MSLTYAQYSQIFLCCKYVSDVCVRSALSEVPLGTVDSTSQHVGYDNLASSTRIRWMECFPSVLHGLFKLLVVSQSKCNSRRHELVQ